MPVITLPGGIRDTITRALGRDLQKRIANGRAAADITFQFENGTQNRIYQLDFKSGKGKVLATWQGVGDGTDWSEAIPLCPNLSPAAANVGNAINVGDGGLFLFHKPAEENAGHRLRVEFSPLGSSAVYMALEAEGDEGTALTMQPAELYPNQA